MARYIPVLVAAAVALSGCVNTAEIAKALAASERSWCMSVTSIYGTVRVGGTGLASGTVMCSQEGLAVTSGSAVTVPVSLSVAPTVVPAK
jgi:hypothetical protein